MFFALANSHRSLAPATAIDVVIVIVFTIKADVWIQKSKIPGTGYSVGLIKCIDANIVVVSISRPKVNSCPQGDYLTYKCRL